MTIVYCRNCGMALRPSDFDRDRARIVAGSPYCAPCEPALEQHLLPPPLKRRLRRRLLRHS